MSDHGDLHNFGQYVRAVARASGTYFQKPRPVYWEWLFFGTTSPLAPFFENGTSTAISPTKSLFRLEVEFSDHFDGYSRQVVASKDAETHPSHAYSLGVLLAYCYVFGIRDLHKHNLVKTDSHLQAVDAEVVLVNLLLPNETLLLPFKDVGSDLAGSCLIGLTAEAPELHTTSTILQGYCDTFTNVLGHLPQIQKVFGERQEEMRQIPVRHIMRDTRHYREWRTSPPEIPYCVDEVEQLERGDIPYFFKLLDDPKLYKYTDAAGGTASVAVPTELEKAVVRDATNPSVLLEQKRIERLFPTGLLFLAKRLLDPSFHGEINLSAATVVQEGSGISAAIGSQQYQASRT